MGFSQGKAEDAGGLTPAKDNNAAMRKFRDLDGAAPIRWENGMLTPAIDPSAGFGRTARKLTVPELHSLRLLIDESALELFVNDGERVMTSRFFPKSPFSLRMKGTGQMTLYDTKPMEMTFAQ